MTRPLKAEILSASALNKSGRVAPSFSSRSTAFSSVKGERPNISTVYFTNVPLLDGLVLKRLLSLPLESTKATCQHRVSFSPPHPPPPPRSRAVHRARSTVPLRQGRLPRRTGWDVRPKVLCHVVKPQRKELGFAGLGRHPVPVKSAKCPIVDGIDFGRNAGQWSSGQGRIAYYPGMHEHFKWVNALAQVEGVPYVGDPFAD